MAGPSKEMTMSRTVKLAGIATVLALLPVEQVPALTCTISEVERQEFLAELCIIASSTDDLAFTEDSCVPRAAKLAVDAHLGLIEHHRHCGWNDIADAIEDHGISSLIFLEAMSICVGYPVDMNALMSEAKPGIKRLADDTGCPVSLRRQLEAEMPELERLLEFERDRDNLREELEMLGLTIDDNDVLIQHQRDQR